MHLCRKAARKIGAPVITVVFQDYSPSPSAMTCLVCPQIHKKTSFVRPKPGSIVFSFSLVGTGRQNRNVASRVASSHASSSSSSRSLAPVLRVWRRLDHLAKQVSPDTDVLQRHCSAASRSQPRLFISRALRGDAPPQLLSASLSFEYVTGCFNAHRDCPAHPVFFLLCKSV